MVLLANPLVASAFALYADCTGDSAEMCNAKETALIASDPRTTQTEKISALQKAIGQLTAILAKLQSNRTLAIDPTLDPHREGPNCFVPTYDLYIGRTDAETNGEVKKLQLWLKAEGYFPDAQGTGYYGDKTAAAVVKWQKAHGMDFVTTKSGVGPMTRAKMACVNAAANSSSSITFTSPAKGDIFRTGSTYAAKWTGQSSSDQTLVTLKATDPMCSNVGLVPEGERGCGATELGKVKLADGSFQLNLNVGMSPLSQLGNRDSNKNYILFFDTPLGRVISQTFTVAGNDFTIRESYHGKDLYAPGETINFSVGGLTDIGELLSPELGFSAKVSLEWGDRGPSGSSIYHEGTYNASQGRWDFTATAPMTQKNDYDYRIFVYVKCSDVNKCAARYPNLLEKDLIIGFNVSSN